MKVRFHPAAVDEFEEAALYYASQKPGLDLRFIEGVQAAIRAASEAPTRRRVFEREVRRCLVRVFPYAVLYSIEADHILVIAVMHCRREPGYWRPRQKDSTPGPH